MAKCYFRLNIMASMTIFASENYHDRGLTDIWTMAEKTYRIRMLTYLCYNQFGNSGKGVGAETYFDLSSEPRYES